MSLDLHDRLMAARRGRDGEAERFDDHVLAAILAIALDEVATEGRSLAEACGLSGRDLAALVADRFPGAAGLVDWAGAGEPEPEVEEVLLRDLLAAHAVEPATASAGAAGLGRFLAALVARRAMRADHLWQDLGLADRSELTRLLARRFPVLHAGNTGNMRWKKYFYRKLCEAEGFVLCSAPSCAVCTDFASCFGEEDGESRLARVRRAHDTVRRGERPLRPLVVAAE